MNTKQNILSFLRRHAAALIGAAVVAVCLLLIGDALSGSDHDAERSMTREDISVYAAEQERKLKELLKTVDGVGSCDVMITVGEGHRSVYAQDLTKTPYGENSKTVTVDFDGSDSPVTVTVIAPRVTGVAVVCEGGGNVAVRNEVTSLVSKLYGLSSAEVQVSKSK